jgi:tetratricopeptide (TPR) repeat protein
MFVYNETNLHAIYPHAWEGSFLGNLGSAYAALGDARKSIEFYERSLEIDREIGDRIGESIDLENTGSTLFSPGENQKAEENFRQVIHIADEISYLKVQKTARNGLAGKYLFENDLVNARATIEAALQYDVPQNNHNVTALYGIIALRQGDASAVCQAFRRAIAQADEILAKTPEYYDALDAKGLALSGLALCAGDDGRSHRDASQWSVVNGLSSTSHRNLPRRAKNRAPCGDCEAHVALVR